MTKASNQPDAREISDEYVDGFGNTHKTSVATRTAIGKAMGLGTETDREANRLPKSIVIEIGQTIEYPGPATIVLEDRSTIPIIDSLPNDLPIGYHRITNQDDTTDLLFVSPGECFLPPNLKQWGFAIQLYAVRSSKSWGIGDFGDLRQFASVLQPYGAELIQVNPLGAVAPCLPQTDSPYFPTSRRFLNPLYLNIDDLRDATLAVADISDLKIQAQSLNKHRDIDRDAIFKLKFEAFERMWPEAVIDLPFKRFCQEQGESLDQFAAFCTLAECYGGDFRRWPSQYQTPSSEHVIEFCNDNFDRLVFFKWLQWQCDLQLSRADDEVDLVSDLPIGFDPGGFDAWQWQSIFAKGVSIGSPPDAFNSEGQDWGIPPFIPQELLRANFQPFIETIRACLRNSGGFRIDHVMGLFRLFWIPHGMSAQQGTYVEYPSDELLAILAIESQRARTWIAGEDLGTVPEGMREKLDKYNVLSHRLTLFEDQHPRTYPAKTVAAVTTHDLPTIAGLWDKSDMEAVKKIHGNVDEQEFQGMVDSILALTGLPETASVSDVVDETYRALSTAPSAVTWVALEDVLCVPERPNIPGTTNEWPNWRIALPTFLEQLHELPAMTRISNILSGRTEQF